MDALFLDRDGTVIVGIPTYDRVDSLEKVELLPHTIEALRLISSLNVPVFFVTNQAGMAEGMIMQEDFKRIHDKVLELIRPSGIKITETFVCPHGEGSECECRKPKPGMLLQAAEKYRLDLTNCWMVGDRRTDVLAGHQVGAKTALVLSGVKNAEAPEADFVGQDLLDFARHITSQMG